VVIENTVDTPSFESERTNADQIILHDHSLKIEKPLTEELEESEVELEAVTDNRNYDILVECLDESEAEDFVTNKLFLQEDDTEEDVPTEVPKKLVQVMPTSISTSDPSGDDNEKFLLSCLPTMRRLTIRQNVLARLRIQQILFNIEFEEKQ
jgi:hypothetical protein